MPRTQTTNFPGFQAAPKPMTFLWLKALHIFFVVCWFACIFYLPRLFVNSAMATDEATRTQLALMQSKLFRFMNIQGALALVFGLALLLQNTSFYISQSWMLAKLLLVLLLLAYQYQCGRYVAQFKRGEIKHGHVFYRWFNEAPVFLLLGIIILVVVRPFQ